MDLLEILIRILAVLTGMALPCVALMTWKHWSDGRDRRRDYWAERGNDH